MAKVVKKTNKKTLSRSSHFLNPAEQSEARFWKAVEKSSKSLIADLIEKTLPISATPNVFDLEKDTDYRTLLREDLPIFYSSQEEFQEKIVEENWTQDDVDYASEDLTCAYFDLVVKSLVDWLSQYPAFANTSLSSKF